MNRLLLLCSMAVFAQDPPYLREDGWRSLGGGLAGWRTQDGSAMPWRTARGILFDGGTRLGATAAPGHRVERTGGEGVSLSRAAFGDVELSVELLISGRNPVVYFRGCMKCRCSIVIGVTALRSSDGGGITQWWEGRWEGGRRG